MPGKLPIEYAKPDGWEETGPRRGMVDVLTAFTVDAATRTETTVIAMPDKATLEANVDRWRGQVGAPPGPIKPAEVEVGGVKATYLDLEGKSRMLIVLAKRDGQTWFFKLMGDPGVVGKNKEKFEAFVKSVKFTGGGR